MTVRPPSSTSSWSSPPSDAGDALHEGVEHALVEQLRTVEGEDEGLADEAAVAREYTWRAVTAATSGSSTNASAAACWLGSGCP